MDILKNKTTKTLFTLSIVLFSLFIMTCFFAQPSADDFAYAFKAQKYGFWGAQKFEYLFWGGRYFATIVITSLALMKTMHLHYYIYPILMIGFFFLAAYFLLSSLSELLFKNKDKKNIIFFSLLLTLAYLITLPNIAQSIFWMVGASTYTTQNIFLMLLLAVLIKKSKHGSELLTNLAVSFLALATVGFNEMASVCYTALFFLAIILAKTYNFPKHLFIRAMNAFCCCALGTLYMAFIPPGNKVRLDTSSPDTIMNIGVSFLMGVRQTLVFLLKRNLLPPLTILVFIFLISLFVLLIKKNSLKIYKPFTSFAPSLIAAVYVLFSIFFTEFSHLWGTGTKAAYRTQSVPLFIMILASWIIAYNLAVILSQKKYSFENSYKYSAHLINIIFSGYIIFILINIPSYITFAKEYKLNYKIIAEVKNNKLTTVHLPPLSKTPWPIYNNYLVDKKTEPHRFWLNEAWARYFKLDGIFLK